MIDNFGRLKAILAQIPNDAPMTIVGSDGVATSITEIEYIKTTNEDGSETMNGNIYIAGGAVGGGKLILTFATPITTLTIQPGQGTTYQPSLDLDINGVSWSGVLSANTDIILPSATTEVIITEKTGITGWAFCLKWQNNTNLVSCVSDGSYNYSVTWDNCGNNMFRGCTSLVTAPDLPATTLKSYCYKYMFSGCSSLVTAPVLPATTLASNCYYYMFYNCSSLTTAPVLPATTLASNCYQYMFQNCSSLVTAPVLPATTLASNCYQYMFYGCTSLTTCKIAAPTWTATWTQYMLASTGTTGSANLHCNNPSALTATTATSKWTLVAYP